ncbi:MULTISPECIES: diaminopimelate decarboxylase [Methanoculleus]|uniref:Diaminopimelate decarboxylase n=2 Tax=Methanoculleus TaxID=45989 RepID=A3CWU2_METMJ|nr:MULTISPECIES: diaminopimelate decarboxylase [Methanoculleus]ABN57842.1 diaminopimelate decarboxylase [Methanoculleus marisnigri JR1]MCC7555129.1 diaminopimelate decarboxylase [Methanoculleus marisnigri]UYU19228.1 diaminopimelate decarboxylase [Methanoculleus submarinus]
MILPSHLTVRDGHLRIGEHDTVDLAERFGTPLYVTDEMRIRGNFQRLSGALTAHYPKIRVLYAAKANGNLAIFKTLASQGAGADVFSAGEVALALAAGMLPSSLLFNGSSKTPADLALAVEKGIRVSVDSPDELRQLDRAAGAAGTTVEIAFRVNPAIEVPTHPKIATGLATSKFGIPAGQILDAYREALALEHVKPVGIHCHIGSQILDVEPFAHEVEVLIDVARDLLDIGVNLSFIDIGGGLGIPYHRETDRAPTPEEYAEAVMPVFLRGIKELGIEPELWVEPGRWLIGDSTVLLTRVNSVKTAHKTFANVDAGFNLLVRPTMYDSYHEVVAANRADAPAVREYSVTGPICETGDILAKDRMLPELEAGDLIAVLDAGAYGFAMSSQYNSRPRCAEVLLAGEKAALMRRAETIDDLTAPMVTVPWQE